VWIREGLENSLANINLKHSLLTASWFPPDHGLLRDYPQSTILPSGSRSTHEPVPGPLGARLGSMADGGVVVVVTTVVVVDVYSLLGTNSVCEAWAIAQKTITPANARARMPTITDLICFFIRSSLLGGRLLPNEQDFCSDEPMRGS